MQSTKAVMASAWLLGIAAALGWSTYLEAQRAEAVSATVVVLKWAVLSLLAVLPFYRQYRAPGWLMLTSVLALFGWLTIVAGYPLYVGGDYRGLAWHLTVYTVIGGIVYACFRSLDTQTAHTPLFLVSPVPVATIVLVALGHLVWLCSQGRWLSVGSALVFLTIVAGMLSVAGLGKKLHTHAI